MAGSTPGGRGEGSGGPPPERRGFVREGIIAGVLGGTVLAIWFLIVDGVQGQALFTPSLLGSILFTGDPEGMGPHPDTGAVALFTGVHFLIFGVLGVVAAAVVFRAERRPRVILGLVLGLVAFQAFALSFVTVFSEMFAGTVHWWAVLAGNMLGLGVMGAFLWMRHPGVERVTHDEEVFEPAQ